MSELKLIDVAVNLTDPMFYGIYRDKQVHEDDFDDIIARAQERGVEKMITLAGNLDDSESALKITSKFPGSIFSTVGCHPTRCSEFLEHKEGPEDYFQRLLKIAKENKESVVAIGECGLDYDRTQFCPIDVQKRFFKVQFELAKETGLPMILHNRNTNDDFVNMVKEHRSMFSTAVVHSFTGSVEEALTIVNDLDLYIGFNGCSLKTEENLKVIEAIPAEKIMIGTDAPWCDIRRTHASFKFLDPKFIDAPEQFKKKERFQKGCQVKGRNEPCQLLQVLSVIANVKKMDINELATLIYNNTRKVFNI